MRLFDMTTNELWLFAGATFLFWVALTFLFFYLSKRHPGDDDNER